MEKSVALSFLKEYIKDKEKEEKNKKTERLLSALKNVTEEGISFGEQPKYFFAFLTCNSTGVGKSSFQGTENQRTVARDYQTEVSLFIDGHEGAGKKGLELFHLKPGQTINYYHKKDIERFAKETGFQLHLQYFRDLNYTLYDHRLNRHKVNVIKGPFSYPIRPIYAVISKDGDKITVGYFYEKDGEEYIIIEPEELKKKGSGLYGLSPWMLLGFVFPPIFIVALFVILINIKKEKMLG